MGPPAAEPGVLFVPESSSRMSPPADMALATAPRPRPPVILDKVAGLDVDSDLVQENVGVIHIRSVYDFDGAAIADIPALADPAQTSADDRPLRRN